MNFWAVMVDRFPYFMSLLLKGAVMTVTVAAGALALALVLGLLIALIRLSPGCEHRKDLGRAPGQERLEVAAGRRLPSCS